MPTRLTPEEQAASLNWPKTSGIPIVEADTRKKKVTKSKWQEINFSDVDFDGKLRNGDYDNGIAIRLGKTLNGLYAIALDFDGWDAVAEWFGTWDNVVSYANTTRIEWHDDRSRIHLIHLADRPIKNRRIHIKDSFLEARCENNLLFVYPSFNKDGNRYIVLGIETIQLLKDYDLSRLEAKIDSISGDYMSDADRKKYDAWLDLPTTILGVGQGRHDATKFKVIRYYWKYSVEWLNLSDDERFVRAWQWHIDHCKPPRSRDEFDRLCKWTTDEFRARRDELHEKIRNQRRTSYNFEDMPGCISYQIAPNKFITGTPDNKLVEIEYKLSKDESGSYGFSNQQMEQQQQYWITIIRRTFTACKPVRIIKHRNPMLFLETGQKYTMVFKGSEPSGNFTLKQKSLSEIVARLKETDALCDKNIDNALIAQIKGFEQRRLLEVNDDIDYVGFFLDGNDKIIASGIEVKNEISKADVSDALKFVEESKRYYDGRLDLLATSIKWGMVAPISFILKCKGKSLKWLHFWGFPNASKSTTATYILAFDGNHSNDAHVRNISNIDTIARLGDTIGKSTFPKLVDEVNLSGNDNTKSLINQFKSAIDHKVLRSKFQTNRSLGATDIPALSPLILTSNSPPPTNDAAYMRRIIDRSFSQAESHESNSERSKEFEEFLRLNLHKLNALGDFRNWYVMNHQDAILEEVGKSDVRPLDISRKLLELAYAYVGVTMPEWLDELLPENQLEMSLNDGKIAVKNAFESLINASLRNFFGTKIFEGYVDNEGNLHGRLHIRGRLEKLVNNDLLPYIKRDSQSKDLIIYRGILEELYKFGVTRDQLPNLRAFADYYGINYYKTKGSWVARGAIEEIFPYQPIVLESQEVLDNQR